MKKPKSQPADYCVVDAPAHARLSKFERLTLTGGEELERALAMVSEQLSQVAASEQLHELDLTAFQTAAAFYSSEEWSVEPGAFFVPPKAVPRVAETPVHGLSDGLILDLSFPSSYEPRFPEFRSRWEECAENLTVHARMWRHREPAAGTIVAIHGWSMGDQRLNSMAFLPGVFYRIGLDVVLFELPYHGRRTPADKSKGELFPSADVIRTNEAMGQAISDLRELTLYLRERNCGKIGCVGMSLGAYISALWAGLDKLDFCVPIVPVSSMAEMAWGILRGRSDFNSLRESGFSPDLLEKIYRIHSPLTHRAKVERDNIMIIAGIGDKVVPPRQPKLLWDHWKRPLLLWYGGGHAAQLKRREAFSSILRFVAKMTGASLDAVR